ncbi:MAG: sulfotransferase family protein [Thermogutta sp.]
MSFSDRFDPHLRPFATDEFHSLWQADEKRQERPVFLIGIHRRSGTNFLSDAIRLIPEFELPLPIAEDYLLEFAPLLRQYAVATAETQYRKRFANAPAEYERCLDSLYRHLGDALIRFLSQYLPAGKRLLTKTPDPWNLEDFFLFFPEALLIVLVRDGRDCVESSKWGMPGHSYNYWITAWAQNARRILSFFRTIPQDRVGQVIFTRYEDLLCMRGEIERVITFLGCDASQFPRDRFETLPVRGSSFYRSNRKELHWQPVEKGKDFQPVGRWRRWSWWVRWQFRRIAGGEFEALGYVW